MSASVFTLDFHCSGTDMVYSLHFCIKNRLQMFILRIRIKHRAAGFEDIHCFGFLTHMRKK